MEIFNSIKYFGNDNDWSGALQLEDERSHGVDLIPGKFCGSENQKIVNTQRVVLS